MSPRLHDNIVQFHLSDIGEGIKEVTVKEWFIKTGDRVAQFDQICEVQSDKASVTITSRYDGIIRKIYFEVDEIAQTGDALVDIDVGMQGDQSIISQTNTEASETEVQEMEAVDVSETGHSKHNNKKALATPAVRRLAAEHGINITEVPGTGKQGRVLKEDILGFLATRRPAATKTELSVKEPLVQAPLTIAPVRPKFADLSDKDRTEPVKGITKAMVRTMSEALKIPHFGYCDEIDVTRLTLLRKELKEPAAQRGTKFSYMPVVLKACSMALMQYPVLNSTFDAQKETITYKADHNIGVAMDTAQGLLVPNIKRVQTLSVYEIAVELNRLHELGLKGKLGEADLAAGTFSLSNIGSIGGTYAKPVIMPPQVAIGAIGKVQVVPRFDDDGELVKAHVFNVSWSADHRVIDGATMARFSNVWKSYLENPGTMILDMH